MKLPFLLSESQTRCSNPIAILDGPIFTLNAILGGPIFTQNAILGGPIFTLNAGPRIGPLFQLMDLHK